MTFPIVPPGEGEDLDPQWGEDITNAVNDHEDRIETNEINIGLARPLYVRKTTDETVTNNTLQDDDELFLPVAASTQYRLNGFYIYQAASTPGFQCGFSAPSGSTLRWMAHGLAVGVTTDQGDFTALVRTLSDVKTFGVAGIGTSVGIVITGTLVTSTTPGTFRFRWAQNVTNATGSKVMTDSDMTLLKVG